MTVIVFGVIALFGIGYPALFAWIACARTGNMKPKSRADLVTTFADALLALVIVRQLFDWTLVWPVLWLLPVALMAVGVAGSVLRWTQLPVWRENRPVRRSQLYLVLHLLVVVAIIVVLVVGALGS